MVLDYTDLTGFKFIPVFDHVFRWSGIHSENGEKEAVPRRRYFGNFIILIIIIESWAHTTAVYDSLKEEDFKAVTNMMSYMSVTLSSFSKFHIARTHMQVFNRLGNWMVEAKNRRPKEMKQPFLEFLVLKVNRSFFYFGLFAVFFWCSIPLANNFQAFIPTKYPFLDKQTSNSISFPMIQVPIYVFLTVTVSYTATSLLHLLAVFTTEIKLLGAQWSRIVYDKRRPKLFMKMMKDCIEQHIKLLDVMKDLNVIHDSMFGFQVFVFIVHVVSFNFCLVMTTGSNAMSSVFPLTVASIMEFGFLCWMGEEITDALHQFHRSVYMTNWYEASIKDRKNMVIALQNLKRRHFLTGTKVFVASLQTFVEAARQAFSAYTLMKGLTTNE